ncbi:MAG: SUMF1/EgtB/PvdO family nonheme iron enzyme [Chloroflexota bacterium]
MGPVKNNPQTVQPPTQVPSVSETRRQQLKELLEKANQLRWKLKQRKAVTFDPIERSKLKLQLQKVNEEIKEYEDEYGEPLSLEVNHKSIATLLQEVYEARWKLERKRANSFNLNERRQLRLDLENVNEEIKELEDEYGKPLPPESNPYKKVRERWPIAIGVLVVLILVGFTTDPVLKPFIWSFINPEPTVKIEQGEAIIGSSNITPTPGHEAEVFDGKIKLAAFEIDKFEVSNQKYKLCFEAGVCKEPESNTKEYIDPSKSNHPVIGVTATQAAAFCRWRGKRLPTSLEWERAARGTEGLDWPWSDREATAPTPGRQANIAKIKNETVEIDSFPLGVRKEKNGEIYNLVGNVSEWTASYVNWRDIWNTQYDPKNNPEQIFPNTNSDMVWNGQEINLKNDQNLIVRGGNWTSGFDRITLTGFIAPKMSYNYLGFRCVS